jgi:hypothetical protein
MWYYQDVPVDEVPENAYGFIYCVTFTGEFLNKKQLKEVEYPIGSIYIGKKAFLHRKKSVISKRARKVAANKRKKINITYIDSGWKDYYGSSTSMKPLLEKYGKENFKREILCFTFSKAENSYRELEQQILHKVLYVSSFNGWISGKVYRSQLQQSA